MEERRFATQQHAANHFKGQYAVQALAPVVGVCADAADFVPLCGACSFASEGELLSVR